MGEDRGKKMAFIAYFYQVYEKSIAEVLSSQKEKHQKVSRGREYPPLTAPHGRGIESDTMDKLHTMQCILKNIRKNSKFADVFQNFLIDLVSVLRYNYLYKHPQKYNFCG